MTKIFYFMLILLFALPAFADEVESYVTEDFMVDPKIRATEQGKIKRQVGESGYEEISADHVIAGDRFDETPDAANSAEVDAAAFENGTNR